MGGQWRCGLLRMASLPCVAMLRFEAIIGFGTERIDKFQSKNANTALVPNMLAVLCDQRMYTAYYIKLLLRQTSPETRWRRRRRQLIFTVSMRKKRRGCRWILERTRIPMSVRARDQTTMQKTNDQMVSVTQVQLHELAVSSFPITSSCNDQIEA